MRGITGKSNAMWHSGSSAVPMNCTVSAGHWFASAITTLPGYSVSIMRRTDFRNSCVGGSPSPVPPSDS